MSKFKLLGLLVILVLTACSGPSSEQKIRLAVNPWPGYEFLYLAGQLGFFAEQGLNVEIVELSSLADVQRVFIQGRVDAFGSTMIEVVQAAGATQEPVDIILVPDFSNGGDVIIASGGVKQIKDLKGKKVGVEVGSLGMYFLYAALKQHKMGLSDVQVVNVEQLDAQESMQNGQIDAMVTYPPYSFSLLKLGNTEQIFDSTEVPGKIIDTVTLRADAVKNLPLWVEKFHQVWQRTLDYAAQHQQEAYQIMATREGISVEEFAEALQGLEVVTSAKQAEILKSTTLRDHVKEVCDVLTIAKSITFSCHNIDQLVRGYGR